MLKARVITAIMLLAVFLPVTLFAPVGAFGALIAFVVVFAAWGWARLLKLGGRRRRLSTALVAACRARGRARGLASAWTARSRFTRRPPFSG